MAGVLCVYLLIGSAFAFTYGIISALEDGTFFAQQHGGDISDFLYFSFVTQTTTGYGDLTAADDLGRSLAITEALDRPGLPGHSGRADRRQPGRPASTSRERPDHTAGRGG